MSVKVKINVGNSSASNEPSIEFSHPLGGGLIFFAVDEEAGTIKVLVYRHAASVSVSVSGDPS